MRAFGITILVIVAILVFWAALRSSSDDLLSLRQTATRHQQTQETASSRESQTSVTPREEDQLTGVLGQFQRSPFTDRVTLSRGRARDDDAEDEYIEIKADDDNPSSITITGWQVRSIVSGITVPIGTATRIPKYDDGRDKIPVVLAPDAEVFVLTAGSPVSASFRTNKCIGYLEQDRTFTPRLKKECPLPEDEDLDAYGIDTSRNQSSRDEECVRTIKRISRCTDPKRVTDEDTDLPNDCREFINSIDYEWCVNLHHYDTDFFGDTWYIYADIFWTDIWYDDGDTIVLLDNNGRLVDYVEW